MLFGKIFYMIHRTILVSFLRDTIRNGKNLKSRLGAFFILEYLISFLFNIYLFPWTKPYI